MNYSNYLNLVKGLDVIVFDNGINIWFDPNYDHSQFFAWCSNRMCFMGLDSINGVHGECYFICFRCSGCLDPFCS